MTLFFVTPCTNMSIIYKVCIIYSGNGNSMCSEQDMMMTLCGDMKLHYALYDLFNRMMACGKNLFLYLVLVVCSVL